MKAVEEWTGVQRDGAFDVATGDGLLEVPAIDRKQGRVETEIGGGSQERVSSKSLPESERDLVEVVSRARCVEVGPEEQIGRGSCRERGESVAGAGSWRERAGTSGREQEREGGVG